MPRKKSAKNCKFVPWLSAKADNVEGRFIQIGNSMLLSEKFQGLSAETRYIYLCMCMEAGGKREFIFPMGVAKKKYGIETRTLRRSVDSLVEAKFIKKHSMANLREPNEYEFVFGWKLEGIPTLTVSGSRQE